MEARFAIGNDRFVRRRGRSLLPLREEFEERRRRSQVSRRSHFLEPAESRILSRFPFTSSRGKITCVGRAHGERHPIFLAPDSPRMPIWHFDLQRSMVYAFARLARDVSALAAGQTMRVP